MTAIELQPLPDDDSTTAPATASVADRDLNPRGEAGPSNLDARPSITVTESEWPQTGSTTGREGENSYTNQVIQFSDEEDTADQSAHEFHSLPPADGGKLAWLFLAACFVVDTLIWGFPFTFGVFQKHYSAHELFAGDPNIAVIDTCATGLMYFGSPPVVCALRLAPRLIRYAPLAGLLLVSISLAASSFSTVVPHLIATQGILYAIGGTVAYIPGLLYMEEWFIRRRGLAFGLLWSSTGVAGAVFPLLMESLLGHLGFRNTLRVWAAIVLVLAFPVARGIRPRIPPSSIHSPSVYLRSLLRNLHFLTSRPYVLFQIANVVQATGYFLPAVYLPSYAQAVLGADPMPAAAALLCVNIATGVGCISMGWLVDRLPAPSYLLIASLGATVGCLVLWGFAGSLPILYAFGAVYGLFAGAYSATWPGIMHTVVDREHRQGRGVDPMLVFGALAAGRGVGNMISGPLSGALMERSPWEGKAGFGYGSGYGVLIVFTGVTALLGGSSFVWKRLGWL